MECLCTYAVRVCMDGVRMCCAVFAVLCRGCRRVHVDGEHKHKLLQRAWKRGRRTPRATERATVAQALRRTDVVVAAGRHQAGWEWS